MSHAETEGPGTGTGAAGRADRHGGPRGRCRVGVSRAEGIESPEDPWAVIFELKKEKERERVGEEIPLKA